VDTYQRSARYYDLLSGHKDYRGAAAELARLVRAANPAARTWLDVACGTGGHLQHLREQFEVEGLDLSGPMLEVAREKCPGVAFHQASLTDFKLDRRYDAITCLFGSVGYCADFAGLRDALRNMAAHLAPGGVLVIEPWITAERFQPGKLTHDSIDLPDLKIARMYVSAREGDVSILDAHFLVATPAGIERFSERHALSLFTAGQYRDALAQAGLTILPVDADPFGYGLFVAVRSDTA
jgi:SAM-dependent methyltransferase